MGYTWIYWLEKICRQFSSLIGQFVHTIGEGMWLRGWMGVSSFLSRCEDHFIRVYENLVQHPSNDISIIKWIFSVFCYVGRDKYFEQPSTYTFNFDKKKIKIRYKINVIFRVGVNEPCSARSATWTTPAARGSSTSTSLSSSTVPRCTTKTAQPPPQTEPPKARRRRKKRNDLKILCICCLKEWILFWKIIGSTQEGIFNLKKNYFFSENIEKL